MLLACNQIRSFKPNMNILKQMNEKIADSVSHSMIFENGDLSEFQRYVVSHSLPNPSEYLWDHTDYKLVARIPMKNTINTFGSEMGEYSYLIEKKNKSTLYLSIGMSHPMLWYNVENELDRIDTIVDFYDRLESDKNNRRIMAYGGDIIDMKIDANNIIDYILTNKATELLIWGSAYPDFPFRAQYNKEGFTSNQHIVFSTRAMRQQDGFVSISVQTLFSKSVIKYEIFDRFLIIDVSYPSISYLDHSKLTSLLHKDITSDMPIDLVEALLGLPFISAKTLLSVDDLSVSNIQMASIFAVTLDDKEEIKTQLTFLSKQNSVKKNKQLKKIINESCCNLELGICLNKYLGKKDFVDYLEEISKNKIQSESDLTEIVINDLTKNTELKVNKIIKDKIKDLIKTSGL